MAIIINATKNTSYWSYSEMSAKLRAQNKNTAKEVTLSAKKEEVKPVELSKKEEVKQAELSKKQEVQAPATLAPEAEELNVALSPASEPIEEVAPEEVQAEEPIEEQKPEELKIVVNSDELPNQPASIVDIGSKEDEMDYNKDGEVTLDEKLRYLEEQTKENSLPQMTIEEGAKENSFDKIQANKEVKTLEISQQDTTFNQKQLTGVQKFNYNNLQKTYLTNSQLPQHTVTRVA